MLQIPIDRIWHWKYHVTMMITIDPAGRVVIPKSIRERLHLVPGAELEIETQGNQIHLTAPTAESRLVQKQGLLVYDGGQQSMIDIAEFINREREARAAGK